MNEDDKIYGGLDLTNGTIGGKKISDLTDKEYQWLEASGAFGVPMYTAVASSKAQKGSPTHVQMGVDYSTRGDRYDMLPDGWWRTDSDKKRDLELQKNYLVQQMHKGQEAAGKIGIGVGLGLLGGASGALGTIGKGATRLMFNNPYAKIWWGAQSLNELVGENGIRKTVGLTVGNPKYLQPTVSVINDLYLPQSWKNAANTLANNKWWRVGKSLGGDVLAGTMVGEGVKGTKQIYNSGKALYNDVKPVYNLYTSLSPSQRSTVRKITWDVTKRNIPKKSNYAFLRSDKFYNDVYNDRYGLLNERQAGEYPLTFSERRNWVKKFKKDVLEGEDRVDKINIAETNPEDYYSNYLAYDEVVDPVFGWKTQVPIGFKPVPHTAKFGTRRAVNTYTGSKTRNVFPENLDFTAFKRGETTYYPFRFKRNTLRTNMNDHTTRIQVGGHERQHVWQGHRHTPLDEYDSARLDNPNLYNHFTNRFVPSSIQKASTDILDTNNEIGNWEGSIGEWDAEYKGWRAAYGFPRFTDASKSQQQELIRLFNDRFKIPHDVTIDAEGNVSTTNKIAENFYRAIDKEGYKAGGKIKSGSN